MALVLERQLRASAAHADAANARDRGALPPEPAASPRGEADLTWVELKLSDHGLDRRALVLYPTRSEPGQSYPALLLFHGRGETTNVELGIHAWRTRYGLEKWDSRLRHPPLELEPEERRFIEPKQLARLQASLVEKPYQGLILICPFTPNTRRGKKPERALDRYSEWIEHTLLPAVREHATVDMARGIGIDGCSLGGYMAAEVFLRKPHLFRSFGVVQPAVGEDRVARYARHLARALSAQSLRAIHLQTSTRDPYRGAVHAFARHLKRQGARFTLDVLPGPHDQHWLRGAGTLAMLAWHNYTLR